jgi:hypothetical protein
MEHLGIDVHKVESQICILTESGEVVERLPSTRRTSRPLPPAGEACASS